MIAKLNIEILPIAGKDLGYTLQFRLLKENLKIPLDCLLTKLAKDKAALLEIPKIGPEEQRVVSRARLTTALTLEQAREETSKS
jgi:hypothetical protein